MFTTRVNLTPRPLGQPSLRQCSTLPPPPPPPPPWPPPSFHITPPIVLPTGYNSRLNRELLCLRVCCSVKGTFFSELYCTQSSDRILSRPFVCIRFCITVCKLLLLFHVSENIATYLRYNFICCVNFYRIIIIKYSSTNKLRSKQANPSKTIFKILCYHNNT